MASSVRFAVTGPENQRSAAVPVGTTLVTAAVSIDQRRTDGVFRTLSSPARSNPPHLDSAGIRFDYGSPHQPGSFPL